MDRSDLLFWLIATYTGTGIFLGAGTARKAIEYDTLTRLYIFAVVCLLWLAYVILPDEEERNTDILDDLD